MSLKITDLAPLNFMLYLQDQFCWLNNVRPIFITVVCTFTSKKGGDCVLNVTCYKAYIMRVRLESCGTPVVISRKVAIPSMCTLKNSIRKVGFIASNRCEICNFMPKAVVSRFMESLLGTKKPLKSVHFLFTWAVFCFGLMMAVLQPKHVA